MSPHTLEYVKFKQSGKCVTCGHQNDRISKVVCSKCAKRSYINGKKWRRAHLEHCRKVRRKWFKRNPTKAAFYRQRAKIKNPDYNNQYYHKNKTHILYRSAVYVKKYQRTKRYKELAKKYKLNYRKKHRLIFLKQRKAQGILSYAKKLHKIKIKACRRCGTFKNIQAHHPNYDKPLKVIWLCSKHHIQLHIKERNKK